MGMVNCAVDGGHARVVPAAVGAELAFQVERRVGIDHPGYRGGGKALVVAEVAEALACPGRPR